ncbi:Very long-chain fatty acid transport protein [Cladobotryum mycophilum]|uniref:Very long-chain fatty acid transport protein n=1 Tax=Cladobotryum mycophilum TaxID=491253 RepID=A0ABR0SLL1_9HYPO
MPVPLALAAPAAAASLAYIHAKSGFAHDYALFKVAFLAAGRIITRRRTNRINLFFDLEERAKNPKTTSRAFLIFEGKTFTYAEVYEKSLRYGNWLKTKLGVKPKDMVAMDFQNSDTFIFIWFAIWSIGATPSFINYNLTGKSLSHCIKTSETKICLIDPEVASTFDDSAREDLGDVNLIIFTPEVEAEASSFPSVRGPDADLAENEPTKPAILIFTSGTTGLPKPAIVAWTKVYFGGTSTEVMVGRGSKDDIMYTSMPLYHASAAVMSVCSTITAGTTQALGRKFSTKLFWEEVRACNATSIQYVGETLRYLLAAPPQRDPITGEDIDKKHQVQTAFGNGLRPDIWSKFKERFGIGTIVEFYAATDGPAATWTISKNDFTNGVIGRIGWFYRTLLGRQWTIVELDYETDLPKRDPKTGFCKKVSSGEPGEMLYCLPAENVYERFQGYYKNPKANNAKIMRDVFAKGDAYFRTGDVMRWDSDGRIYFNDRIGDTFRWKSENVSTTEVSEAVSLHPRVREANVYGVELPHHDGRAGCVAICFDQEVPDSETLRSLAEHVKATLPRYAQPLFLRLVHEIAAQGQTTGTNKQQKHHLRKAGVKPTSGEVDIYWLKGGSYVPFSEKEWRELEGGRVRL